MFCPMKLYLQKNMDEDKTDNIQLNLEIKKIKIDTQDLIQKNMRKLKKEMNSGNRRHTIRKHRQLP